MWHFDIYDSIYSADMNRKITIYKREGEHTGRFPRRRCKESCVYTLYEEWHTPNSQGDTGDFDYYTFMTYQDAAVFIAKLAMSFNSLAQNVLMRAAEVFATKITKDYKKDEKQVERKQKEQEAAARLKQEQALSKHVYIFEMSNNTVKIGVSNAVGRRRQDVQNSSGLDIRRWCYTKRLKKERAFEIESACHAFFKEYRTRGEFFNVPYETARAKLSKYERVFDETATPN